MDASTMHLNCQNYELNKPLFFRKFSDPSPSPPSKRKSWAKINQENI
jgi:hypothetical protein